MPDEEGGDRDGPGGRVTSLESVRDQQEPIAVTFDVYGHMLPDDQDALAAGLDAVYRAVP